MYLIQDFSHTQKHLKIEHTFSSKNYDQQTLQTYLTKVINNRNAQIINYYKYHINEHILPYLKLKNSSSKPSNLRLSEENPQIMIKINQFEKDKNMKMLGQRINGYLKQLRTFKLIKNMEFKNELQNMEEFIKRMDKPQGQIQRIINQAQSSISSLYHLHQQFSIQQITPQLSLRLDKQKEGEEVAIIEKLKLFSNLFQFQSKKQNIVWQDIKPDRSQQMKKSIESFSLITQSCISSLNIHENYLNIEEIYQMLKEDQLKIVQQSAKVYEANVLYINRKFIKGSTLRQMILSKDSRITSLFCRDLSKNIVDFILRDGGVKNLFITSENIIVEDFGKFHVNYFSFVGLEFIKLQKYVSKRELQQILPYLTSYYIDSENPCRQMNLQVYLRFIIVNFISAYFKKDIVYDYQKVDFQVEVRRDKIEKIIKKINSDFLPEILTEKDIQNISQNFDKNYMVNYTKLVQFIFTRQQKEKLTWEYMLSFLGCTIPVNNLSSKQWQQLTIDDVINLLLRFLANPSAICFDWLSINIFQVVDHFTDILEYFVENIDQIEKENKEKEEKKDEYSEKRKIFEKKKFLIKLGKMKKLSKQLSAQRDYFKNNGRYCHILYLPIKCRFTFCKILDYHNWIGLLAGQKNPDSQTYQAAQNLFSFLLELQQAMIFLSDYLNDEIIKKTLLRRKRTFLSPKNLNKQPKKQRQSSQKYTYLSILRQYLRRQRLNNPQYENTIQVQSDSDDDDENKLEKIKLDQSLKDVTLKYFFKSTKIVFFILRYYFRNMSEIIVAGDIRIHYGFAKTLESFVPYDPFPDQKDDLKQQDQ